MRPTSDSQPVNAPRCTIEKLSAAFQSILEVCQFTPAEQLRVLREVGDRVAGKMNPNERAESGAMTGRAAARQYIKSLKDAEGGAYTSAEYEQLAGIVRRALKERRDHFAIAYWTDVKGGYRYPKWQFDANHQVRPEVREILKLLRTHDTWHVLATFLVPAMGDSGESPLHAIRAGRGGEAIAFVRRMVNER